MKRLDQSVVQTTAVAQHSGEGEVKKAVRVAIIDSALYPTV